MEASISAQHVADYGPAVAQPARARNAERARPRHPIDVRAVSLLLAPLDAIRLRLLHALGPLARVAVRSRSLRVALMGSAVVAFALLGTATLPIWMLAVAPVVLGVPHLIADARYMIVRPGLLRRPLLIAVLVAPLVGVLRGGGVMACLVGAAAVVVIARGSHWRRAIALVAVGGLGALVWYVGPIANMVFSHVHHLVALALLWMWRPRGDAMHWIPFVLFVLASVAIFLGAVDPILALTGGLGDVPAANLGLPQHLSGLAKGLDGALAIRLVLAFTFAQSVHYAAWVRLIPEEDRPRETPRTFADSYRALRADLGVLPCLACIAGALVITGWALADLAAARAGYLRVSMLHGHIELALAALFFVEGRPIDVAARSASAPASGSAATSSA